MGLFFKNKKNKPEKKVQSKVEEVKLNTPIVAPDMISLIKSEQEEILNPFDTKKREASRISVAKKYGGKYVSMQGQQLASSKVVDVRSYVKPAKEQVIPEKKEKTAVEKELELLNEEKKEEDKAKSSFFDEILKSLEEDDDDDDDAPIEDKLPIPEPVKVASPVKRQTSSSVTKKKKRKSIDIDIISGDFGGSDII